MSVNGLQSVTQLPQTRRKRTLSTNWPLRFYGGPRACMAGQTLAITRLPLELYFGTPVKDFGIRALSTVRDSFVAKDYSRKYCNKLTGFVRKMFVWGIQYEFVTQEVAGALKLVPPVHRKQAHDNPRRKLVPVEVVKATLPYLSPMIRDMVCVQLLAIMRPSEIRRMQVGDIDKSQEIWIYRPGKHKGTWREHHKAIALGKPEQVILERRMAGKEPGRYVFTPAEAMQERWERAASKRKTPVQPSQQERKEEHAKNPKCRYREYYKAESYYNHIARAIKSANKKLPDDKQIPHWFPYKMRHTGVTELAKMEGLEVARAVVGHRLVDTTMGYNHADEAIALEAAKKRQNPLE